MPNVVEPVTEQPVEAPLSIADHAKQFGAGAVADPEIEVDAEPEKVDPLKPIRPVDQQKREEGKFAPGKQRIKAKDAVERINQLTGRAKTAEEKLAAAETELATLRTQRAAPQQIAKAEQKVERAETRVAQTPADDPEPSEAELESKYNNDYAALLMDRARWAARDEHRKIQIAAKEAEARGQLEQADRLHREAFKNRVTELQKKYPDYDQVAFGTVPAWINPQTQEPYPWGMAIDGFIREHDIGAEVLYYLNQHPEEHDALFRKSALIQIADLVAIAQRFASPSASSAGTTGSVASTPRVVLPPKPPNPVRTEAHRASDDPPKMDGSLGVRGHAQHWRHS